MEMIRNLQIKNYKSIKEIDLNCARINILIGRPNVGKSNILEALDLMYLSWFFNTNQLNERNGLSPVNLKEYFRVNKVQDLFHLGGVSREISISHPGFSYGINLRFNNSKDENGVPKNTFEWVKDNGQFTEFTNDFEPIAGTQFFGSPIHPYKYKKNIKFFPSSYINVLMPPYGSNLTEVIQFNPSFRDFIGEIANEYGFEFNIDTSSYDLSTQLRVGKGLVYSVAYEALAETLKRLLFYVASIRYNNASVITLEEPEVHSFPPYVSFLADEIIRQKSCQFFIATHSPYLLNNLIENAPSGELAVFICGYDKSNFQTTVKKLSEEDLSELLNFGVDIFFNINRYEDGRIKDNS